jgi:hypothetical protein
MAEERSFGDVAIEKFEILTAAEHGRTHLRFCEEKWFKEPSYVTWQIKPLLLVFGPADP